MMVHGSRALDSPSLLSLLPLLSLLSLMSGVLHFFFAFPKLCDLSAGQSPKSEASKVVAWLFLLFVPVSASFFHDGSRKLSVLFAELSVSVVSDVRRPSFLLCAPEAVRPERRTIAQV